jgi:L-amino acid N-acyltransferase YncA
MTGHPHVQVRDSRDEDLGAIQKVYAHHVRHGTGSFELEPPDLVEMMRRRAEVLRNGFPYLVAYAHENGHERVLGYAYVNFFRLRPAYRFTVENSIYIDAEAQRNGVGRLLLGQLIARCEALGLRQVVAVIGDSANTPSIALHAAAGFRFAGLLRASGWKFDRWLDTVLMQRELGDADRVPAEPGR